MKKYQFILHKRTGILCLFLLFSLLVGAQYTQGDDSIAAPQNDEDTTSMIETEDETVTKMDAVAADREPDYFLKKNDLYARNALDSIRLRQLPQDRVRALQQDGSFWYANYAFDKEKEKSRKFERVSIFDNPVFETFLWFIIIIGFVAFVILYLANSNVGIFRKSRRIDPENSGEETDDIFAINYQKEIDKAVDTGNYRFAVRMMFLRLLRKLSDKEIIQYKVDRTNFDYLLQLNGTNWYPDFFKLTRHYEYSWYGQFELDNDKFSVIRKEFENFDYKLN